MEMSAKAGERRTHWNARYLDKEIWNEKKLEEKQRRISWQKESMERGEVRVNELSEYLSYRKRRTSFRGTLANRAHTSRLSIGWVREPCSRKRWENSLEFLGEKRRNLPLHSTTSSFPPKLLPLAKPLQPNTRLLLRMTTVNRFLVSMRVVGDSNDKIPEVYYYTKSASAKFIVCDKPIYFSWRNS